MTAVWSSYASVICSAIKPTQIPDPAGDVGDDITAHGIVPVDDEGAFGEGQQKILLLAKKRGVNFKAG